MVIRFKRDFNFSLKDCLFGAVKLTKNVDPNILIHDMV